MEQPRITINLNQYEDLNRTINKKDEYINECVINGKIKRNDVTYTLFSRDINLYSHVFGGIRLVSKDYTEYLTKKSLDSINSKNLKESIAEIYKYKTEWESDFKSKIKMVEDERIDINSKSFIERLVYLFTGNF